MILERRWRLLDTELFKIVSKVVRTVSYILVIKPLKMRVISKLVQFDVSSSRSFSHHCTMDPSWSS